MTLDRRAGAAFGVVRDVARGGLAGVMAGIAGGGIGGRVAMRLSALIDPGAAGLRTENGNRIGEFTLDGTFALVVFGGVFGGLVVGVVWVLIRDFLPEDRRPMWAAGLAIPIGAFNLIVAENRDFAILDPPWAHVLILLGVVASIGYLTAVADRWLDRRLPAVPRLLPAFGFGGLSLLGLPIVVPALGGYFTKEFCFCDDPPWAAGVGVVLAGLATGWWFVSRLLPGGAALQAAPAGAIRTLGRAGLMLAALGGTFHLVARIAAIL